MKTGSKTHAISKVLIGFVALAFIGGGFAYYRKNKTESRPKFTPSRVTRETISTSVLSTGVVKPENRVEIKASIAGRAEKVLVNEGAKIKKGQPLVISSSTERAALLDAASSRGAEELDKWRKLYRETPILAPVDGEVILRNIEEGQTFSTTDAILVMSDRLVIEANVDETDLARVHLGQVVNVIADAYPDQNIKAKVGTIAHEATTVNNVTTYVVKVIPLKAPSFLRSGMTANVRFQLANRENVLVIPNEAVVVENGKYAVYKASGQGDDDSERRVKSPITVGLSDGKQTEVTDGVTENETIYIPPQSIQDDSVKGGTNPFGPSRGPRRKP